MSQRSSDQNPKPVSPTLVTLAGWVLPGAGYWLIGQRDRAMVIGASVLGLFLLGIFFAGIRVIDVPGFDRVGGEVRLDARGRRMESTAQDIGSYNAGSWALAGHGFFGEMANKPWYVAQIFTGPICLVASKVSLWAARSSVDPAHARLFDIGTLYTAVAGMLNLLAIIDAAHRAANPAAEVATPSTAIAM